MGRGVIDAPMENVVGYLQKFQNRLEYDETLLVHDRLSLYIILTTPI